ncbi:MAG: PAS domain-containing protein, partial [Leptolyngbyaceae cyanobacterium bins.59]|nr:PAS domain-containing protein [Leptolyngbyaceae cyanobacterium bins.59]
MIPHALDCTSQALYAAIVREPLVILPKTTVQAAIVLMDRAASQLISSSKSWQESNPWNQHHHAIRAGCMVVVEKGQVVGLLTERDVVRLNARQQDLENLSVGEVMTHPVMTLRESSLTDPAMAMALLQPPVRYLPILNDQDALVGIMTLESLSLTTALPPTTPTQPKWEERREPRGQPPASLPDDRTLIEQLRQSEAKARALLRAIPDLLLRVGRDGTCYDFIPPADAEVGTFLPIKQHISEILPPDVLQHQMQRVEQALSTGELQIWEHQIPKNGVLCDEEIRLIPCGADECLVIVRDVTERNRAAAALCQSEIQYRQIIETAIEGIWIVDADSKTSFVNFRMAEMLGYHVSDFLGKSIFDFMDLADSSTATQNVERRRQGIAEQHEFKLRHKNGTDVWVLMSTNPMFDESGRYFGALGMVVDISERKQVELALAQSEAQQRAVLSAIPDLMFRVGSDGTYREFVTQDHSFDVIPQDINPTHQAMMDLLPTEIAERQLHYLNLALKTGELQVYEQQIQLREQARYEEVRVIKSGNDEVLFMVRDISDRKRSEFERQQAEKTSLELKLLEHILDIVLAGYWDWDIANDREYLSPGFKKMFGYEDHELPNLPETWQNLILPEDLAIVFACFDRHIQSRGEISYYNEVRYRHKNGSVVWVICSGQVIEWDAAGNPLRMIGCHINITDRKQAEAELQQISERLALALKSGEFGCWEWNIPQNILLWDERMHELYGVDPHLHTSTVYETWANALHPDDREAIETIIQQTVLGKAEYNVEFRIIHPD